MNIDNNDSQSLVRMAQGFNRDHSIQDLIATKNNREEAVDYILAFGDQLQATTVGE